MNKKHKFIFKKDDQINIVKIKSKLINKNNFKNNIKRKEGKGKKYKINNIEINNRIINKIYTINSYFLENILNLLLLLIILFPLYISKKTNERKLLKSSEITIIIKGYGEQAILSNSSYSKDGKVHYFNKIPDEILVNGISQEYKGKIVYNLSSEINSIKMIWNEPLINCDLMFLGLSNITEIDLSKLDSSKIESMLSMFHDCENLISINFNNFDTSLVTNMCNMFFNCKSLVSVNLNNFNTISVIDLSYMFKGCQNLISIDLSNFNTPNLKYLGSMFYYCTSLKEINLNNLNTSSLLDMNSMFYDCTSLTSIDLSNFNTPSLEKTSKMFYNCTKLKSLNISNFDTSKITDMSFMFSICNSLKELDLKGFITSSVKNMKFMFNACNNLEILDLSNFNVSSVTEMQYMFNDCKLLKSINFLNFNTSSVKNMSNMFRNCVSLSSINLSSFRTTSLIYMDSMFLGCSSLISIDLSNFNTPLLEGIGSIFSDCSSLKYVNLSNFNTTSALYMDRMFFGCNSLVSLDMSSFDTSNAKNMNYIFSGCSSLESLDLSNFNTLNVIDMNSMFSDCKSLKTLNLSNFKTSNVIDMHDMFSNCISLLSLDISNFNILNVQYIDHIFYNCNSLISLNLYNFSSNSYMENLDYAKEMFTGCNESLIYCINENNILSPILYQLSNFSNRNCSNECFLGVHKLFPKERICIENCINLFEYNNICYEFCPNNTYYNYNMIECIDNIPEGYYLNDSQRKTIDKCEEKCKICNYQSNKNNLCISCNNEDGYVPKYINGEYIDCSNKFPEGHYYDNYLNMYMPCFIDCKNNNNENNEIINYCNSNYSSYYLKCKEICSYNYENCLINDLHKEINNNSLIYYYEMDSEQKESKEKYKNITYLDFNSETKKFLDKKFNLNETDKIIIVIIDYEGNDSNLVTNDFIYHFILENGTELNLSQINEDFYTDIFVPIKDLDLAHYNYSLYFMEQGYDIYDINSRFYNDKCTPAYINENDITLKDRKNYIYPNNVSLCKNNCNYKDVDRDGQRIICNCNLNENNKENSNYEVIDEEDDDNFMSYFLDNINYKIFKCTNLLLNFDNLKKNFAFYSMLCLFFFVILFNFAIYFFEITRLKNLVIKQIHKFKKYKRKSTKKRKTKSKIYQNPIKKLKRYTIKPKKKKENNFSLRKKYKAKSSINLANINSVSNLKNSLKSPSTIKLLTKNVKNKPKSNEEKIDLNELPFSLAIYQDKRNIFLIFISIIIQKIDLINLFLGDEKIKILLISQYILSLLINFFFNALLYSDEIVSRKYHNNGKLDFFVTLILSLLSNIITSIVCFFVNCSKGIEEKLSQLFEIRIKNYHLENINWFFRNVKIKIFLFYLKAVLVIACCFYYIIIFFIIYKKSRISLLINYLSSLLEGLITSFIISIIIAITRKLGLIYLNRYIYNTSKYINNKF